MYIWQRNKRKLYEQIFANFKLFHSNFYRGFFRLLSIFFYDEFRLFLHVASLPVIKSSSSNAAIFKISLSTFNGTDIRKILSSSRSPFSVRLFISSPLIQCLLRAFASRYLLLRIRTRRTLILSIGLNETSFVSEISNSLYTVPLCLRTWATSHVRQNSATNGKRRKHTRLMRDPAFYCHLHFRSNQGKRT